LGEPIVSASVEVSGRHAFVIAYPFPLSTLNEGGDCHELRLGHSARLTRLSPCLCVARSLFQNLGRQVHFLAT
jgi:hypothetical protein